MRMWSLCSCLKEPLAIPAQLVSNENGVSKEKPRANTEAHTSGATSSDTQHEAGKRNQRPLAETGSSEGNATNYAGQPPAVSAAISEERELCEKRRGQGATASTAEGSVVLPGVPTGEPAEASQIQQRFSFSELGDLRNSSYGKVLPEGKCLYIQCGDPSDFDGYLIARAGEVLSMTTRDMIFAVVVPEERSENRNVAIPDARAEVSLDICGRMLRSLCPTAQVVRGPLNERNIFALMNAPDKYKPALMSVGDAEVRWTSVEELASLVNQPDVTSLMLDLMGSSGFMQQLTDLCPGLPAKVKHSGFPVPLMCGVLAERMPQTIKIPGRDPRAGMNSIYHRPKEILDLATSHGVPLLFVSNNCTRDILRFDDDKELVKELGLTGLLKQIAECWFAPHLRGKYVVFDWVALVAMLLYERQDEQLTVESRELWVGEDDCSVMVLKRPTDSVDDETVRANLEGTYFHGTYKSVIDMDRRVLLDLARDLKLNWSSAEG